MSFCLWGRGGSLLFLLSEEPVNGVWLGLMVVLFFQLKKRKSNVLHERWNKKHDEK
jgi:hypothetical protein